jgi:hypothetical protein
LSFQQIPLLLILDCERYEDGFRVSHGITVPFPWKLNLLFERRHFRAISVVPSTSEFS